MQQKDFSAKLNIKLLLRIIGLVMKNDRLGSGEILKRIMSKLRGMIRASLADNTVGSRLSEQLCAITISTLPRQVN